MAKRTSSGGRTAKTRRRDATRAPAEISTESSLERAFVPEADVLLPGVDRATGQRVCAARAGFMEALVRDSRVADLIASWVEKRCRLLARRSCWRRGNSCEWQGEADASG
jgi:hypothetical protein